MPSTLSLLDKVKADNPNFTFVDGDTFLWLPDTRTVFYDSSLADGDALLLHEVSHGLLNHQEYKRDVELLAIEAAAWDKAKLLAKEYGYAIDSAVSEDHLDTYRDWLHARSTCPECTATGYQSGNDSYSCPACTTQWRVNEARVCELRRYKQKLPL